MMIRTTDPASEPVTLAEARLHLKLDASGSPESHPDDDLVNRLIPAAREWCETYTGRSFFEQTWQVKLDEFKDDMRLPRPPLISVTSIQYIDLNGDTQALSSSVYTVDTVSNRVLLAYGQTWPSTRSVENAVTITYQAGYDSGNSPQDDTAIPSAIKAAILLMVGSLYENRQEVMAGLSFSEMMGNSTVRSLLGPYMVDKYGSV